MALLVSVGTDGYTDWLRLPDGQKLNLGALSVLNFVAKLGGHGKKLILEAYLRDGEAMLRVDEDRMWALLTPRRMWAAREGLFMPSDPAARKEPMTTISTDLNALEQHIMALSKAAGKVSASKMQEGLTILEKLASKIVSPNQSKNETYYGLGEPKVYEVGDKVAGLAYDTFQANSALAQQIIAKSEETAEKIDKLAAAGKPFNAAKAKADVYAVASKTAGILRDVDLTASWVQGDLQKLAAKADQLHGLFIPAKG